MNDSAPNSPSSTFDVVQFARATRFALFAIVLCVSYFSIRSSMAIGHFEMLFHDMLGGKPLPVATGLVIRFHILFVLTSLFIPLTALATLCLSNLARSVTILGWLVLVAFAEFLALYQALSAPIFAIIQQMGGTP